MHSSLPPSFVNHKSMAVSERQPLPSRAVKKGFKKKNKSMAADENYAPHSKFERSRGCKNPRGAASIKTSPAFGSLHNLWRRHRHERQRFVAVITAKRVRKRRDDGNKAGTSAPRWCSRRLWEEAVKIRRSDPKGCE